MCGTKLLSKLNFERNHSNGLCDKNLVQVYALISKILLISSSHHSQK